MPELEGEVAVVTGAASGIGREIALRFAREGASVVCADVRAEPREGGTPTHERVASETDSEATFVRCDVTEEADVEAAMDAAENLGGVSILVNNAGLFRRESFLDVTREEFDRLLEVNVTGAFFVAQAAAQRMVDADREGAIVNLSSIAGIRGTAGYASYCASKGAVRSLTYALADELGPEGIRVNAIHPGVVETSMTTEDFPIVGSESGDAYRESIPLQKWGQPDDIAEAALYLASDRAGYVNGESLVVDGGATNTS
jgi:NAD(P)-dependent dehydrogenase (short-subunit alcohol dehydrogenase family)